MREARGDIWSYTAGDRGQYLDAVCVLTNMTVKANRFLVMGAGQAKEAADRVPWIAGAWGVSYWKRPAIVDGDTFLSSPVRVEDITTTTDATHEISPGDDLADHQFPFDYLVSFPTKVNYQDNADPRLIMRSATDLVTVTDAMDWDHVVMPRPGCGHGGLRWDVVKHIIEPIFDDRFVVITR